MAVFWFGLGKKIKNIFTKKEADKLYGTITDVNTNKTEIAALKEVDSRIWDTMNTINAKIDDSIQTINNTPLRIQSDSSKWDFWWTTNASLRLAANTWTRLSHTQGSQSKQLSRDRIYLMQIELGSFTPPYKIFNLIVRLKDYEHGIAYAFSVPGQTYAFALRWYSTNTIEINPGADIIVKGIALIGLYIK